MEKIVVTGMGSICALGENTNEIWKNVRNGVSGLGPITQFDPTDFRVKIACEIKDFDPTKYLHKKETRRRHRHQLLSYVAVNEAVSQSGLDIANEDPSRMGVIISSAVGGLGALEENVRAMMAGGYRRVSPFLAPMLMANGAAALAGIDHGFQGPSFAVLSACASGEDGIGVAWIMLRAGLMDVAITGGADAVVTELGMAAFDRIGALSLQGPDGMVPKPFDKNRDGFVMGEGAGIFVLETESHAKARGAEIIAELAGFTSTADAFHITAPHGEGAGGSRAMTGALSIAGINPDEVDYINAHGTGTMLNDIAETQAIKTTFGKKAYQIPVSSTKSMTGHMMGATGAMETILCIKAIRDNVLPPTINYETPDPDCDLDYVPNEAREKTISVAMSNAFGFGGHNSVLVVKEYS